MRCGPIIVFSNGINKRLEIDSYDSRAFNGPEVCANLQSIGVEEQRLIGRQFDIAKSSCA
jgi:hypothetical protein